MRLDEKPDDRTRPRLPVGTAALRIFAWCGRMSHDLVEPTLGAPLLAADDAAAGAARLRGAVRRDRSSHRPGRCARTLPVGR